MKWFKTFIILSFLFIPLTSAFSSPEEINNVKEYSILRDLYKEGHNNSNLLLRLSSIAPDPSEALCYARLGLEIDPNSTELKNRISDLRNNSKIKEDMPSGVKSKNSSPSLLILENFASRDLLSTILIITSSISILLFLFRWFFNLRRKINLLIIVSYSLSIFLFAQIFLVTKTKDGRFRLVNSFRDFNKIEGVVLTEKIVYSAPSETSQQINILKPSWEINIYKGDPKMSWRPIESSDKRQGWIKDMDGICQIKN